MRSRTTAPRRPGRGLGLVSRKIGYRFRCLPRSPAELNFGLLLLGAYRRAGFFKSAGGSPYDAAGNEIPWFCYPAIHWLESVLTGNESVFEWGSGNSTIWFGRRVAWVVSVESDLEWARVVTARAGPRSSVLVRPLKGIGVQPSEIHPYIASIGELGTPFDVVVVDGRARVACLMAAQSWVAPDGIIILDDSERARYRPGLDALDEAGFERLDFTGIGPRKPMFATTSVFSRDMSRWLRGTRYPPEWRYPP